jgi:hypothetical protein
MIVPPAPEGVSLHANMSVARHMKWVTTLPQEAQLWVWFYTKVKNGGPWDFKKRGRQFEKFGNFHYGAVGTCAGFSAFVLHRAAGAAQFRAGTIAPEVKWIDWFIYPFGDDKNDQEMIAEGIKYANSRTW